MRRPFVTVMFALALALPAANLYAQAPAAQHRRRRRAPRPNWRLPADAGILLVQIKPDQTAVFEEMIGKLKAGLAKTEDATLKQQAAGFNVYKAAEPFGANALYVVMIEPVIAGSEVRAVHARLESHDAGGTARAGSRRHVEAISGGLRRGPQQAESDQGRGIAGAGREPPLHRQNFRFTPA